MELLLLVFIVLASHKSKKGALFTFVANYIEKTRQYVMVILMYEILMHIRVIFLKLYVLGL